VGLALWDSLWELALGDSLWGTGFGGLALGNSLWELAFGDRSERTAPRLLRSTPHLVLAIYPSESMVPRG
jgi:hypothetical protein